jgi:hypothetical protein
MTLLIVLALQIPLESEVLELRSRVRASEMEIAILQDRLDLRSGPVDHPEGLGYQEVGGLVLGLMGIAKALGVLKEKAVG